MYCSASAGLYCAHSSLHYMMLPNSSSLHQSTIISTMSQGSSSVHSSSESSYDYESDSSDDFDPGNFLPQQLNQQDLPLLYNQEPITCPICTEQIEEGLAVILPSCQHLFCTACFLRYLNSRIGEGDADAIGCSFILKDRVRVG